MDGADEVVPAFHVLGSQAEAPTAEEVDLQSETDPGAEERTQGLDPFAVGDHATTSRGGPDLFDEGGVALPAELEGIAGEVEGEGVFREAQGSPCRAASPMNRARKAGSSPRGMTTRLGVAPAARAALRALSSKKSPKGEAVSASGRRMASMALGQFALSCRARRGRRRSRRGRRRRGRCNGGGPPPAASWPRWHCLAR